MEKYNKGETLGILVGGGPAPGINGVIRSATIEAIKHRLKVIGILDGFKWLSRGDNSKVMDLTIDKVSRIHFSGGSILGISRTNPTADQEKLNNVVRALRNLHIDYLITIGGDDTAYTAYKIDTLTGSEIEVAHVPKTIDNDLPIPGLTSTFGYQTARHVGVKIVQNIMTDAATTNRWYFIVTMGRSAGHLALGIGKAASATITLIPEEFPDEFIKLDHVCDILEGSIIKRRALGKEDGVAILAEGLMQKMLPEELNQLEGVEKDDHGNIRYSEIDLGSILKTRVKQRLKARCINTTVVAKNIGYELRCASPIPFDTEYTQDLGYSAVKFLLQGNTGAMICIDYGKLVPLYFTDIMDTKTGRTKIRLVNIDSEKYRVARNYMIRLNKEDFNDQIWIAKLARTANMSVEEFIQKFKYLTENEY